MMAHLVSQRTLRGLVILAAFWALSFQASAASSDTALPFSGLKTDTLWTRSTGPAPIKQQITYAPAHSTRMKQRLDVEHNSRMIDDITVTRILLTRIDRNKPERVYIDFDYGESEDPAFAITDARSNALIGTIEADHVIIPGDGFIYAKARKNREFLERRKFFIRAGQLVESSQPYLYVGLDSRALQDFKLLAAPDSSEVVATIRKGERVHVLLNDKSHYLIRTPFGLLGWVKQEPFTRDNLLIEGIYFDGD